MEFWRHSSRISRKDKIRNTAIEQKMNVGRSPLDDIKTKQLQWCGHFQRVEEGRLPEVMKWRPPGRRKRGRPKLTWAEGIRGLMGEKGLTFRHRASSIQDRRFATLQRTLFIYLINKHISLSDICLTVHH